MKNLVILYLLSTLIISCAPKDLPTVVKVEDNYALVKMSHMTTETELESIKKQLRETADIEFNYSPSIFLEDGHLQQLVFQIKLPNGTRGTASADLMKLQFNYCGFMYNPDGTPSLKTGIF